MDSRTAKKQLLAREGELAKLTAERDKVLEELQGIQNRRTAAVRKLAGGDDAQRKIILALEGDKKPITDRLEGLDGLVIEAQAAVERAQATLTEAQAQERAAEQEAARAAEYAACEGIASSYPNLEGQIFTAYVTLSGLLGELEMNRARLDAHQGPGKKTVEDLVSQIHVNLQKRLDAAGRKVMVTRTHLLVGATVPDEPGVEGCYWGGTVHPGTYQKKVMGPRQRAEHISKFQTGEK